MISEFATEVDNIILTVLTYLEKIDNSQKVDYDEARTRIRTMLDNATSALASRQYEWELAERALVYWMDERFNRVWPNWSENPLQFERYVEESHEEGQTKGYYDFYARAEVAEQLADKSVLEVFYVCVMLGFRGKYHNDLAELAEWTKRQSGIIELSPVRRRLGGAPEAQGTKRQLDGKFIFLGSMVVLFILGATFGMYLAAKSWLN